MSTTALSRNGDAAPSPGDSVEAKENGHMPGNDKATENGHATEKVYATEKGRHPERTRDGERSRRTPPRQAAETGECG